MGARLHHWPSLPWISFHLWGGRHRGRQNFSPAPRFSRCILSTLHPFPAASFSSCCAPCCFFVPEREGQRHIFFSALTAAQCSSSSPVCRQSSCSYSSCPFPDRCLLWFSTDFLKIIMNFTEQATTHLLLFSDLLCLCILGQSSV